MSLGGFAKSVGSRLLGQIVEVYQGEEHDIVRRAEIETARKTVICGKLVEVLEDCLIIEVIDGGDFTEVYVNTYTVHAIIPLKNGISIFDIYKPDERKQVK